MASQSYQTKGANSMTIHFMELLSSFLFASLFYLQQIREMAAKLGLRSSALANVDRRDREREREVEISDWF